MQLKGFRLRYASASENERTNLKPSILDLEKRIRKLEIEVMQESKLVRNAEIGSL